MRDNLEINKNVFIADEWYAEFGAMLARHGEAGLITDGLDYTITKH